MELQRLSRKFRVRKLKDEDVEQIYALQQGNPLFFQYCPPQVTREIIREDLRALPPGKGAEDKFYLGYFQGERLIAVMDLIFGYPNEETAFLGFFMVDIQHQGKGTGSRIIEEWEDFLRSLGYRFVRLGYTRGNPQSLAFWKKNGFLETGTVSRQELYDVVVMQKSL